MAVTDHGFDGSYATFGGIRVNPLTDYRHTNTPATVRNTGSTDTHHTYNVGRNNQSVTLGFLGSRAPDAGTVAEVTITANSSQDTLSLSSAAITNLSITGRKDGDIRSTMTLRPSAVSPSTSLSGAARAVIGFDGTSLTFPTTGTVISAAPNSLVSLSYTATCAEVDDAGSGDTDVLISPGLPDRTLTFEVMGGPIGGIAKGTTGTSVVAWNDGGTLGGFTNAVVTNVEPGGSLDDAVTTQYTIKEFPAL